MRATRELPAVTFPSVPVFSKLHAANRFAASLVAPPRCGVCGGCCNWSEVLCSRCDAGLTAPTGGRVPVPGLDDAWAAARYEGIAREFVGALKFRGRLSLARRAAEAIAAGAPPDLLDGAIVPVPPAPWRLRLRGHDPAEEIAFALATLTGMPFRPALARSSGPRQVGRRRVDRLADPPSVRSVEEVPPSAVLVDDVVTTGATLAACARALRLAGAERVVAVAFTRA